MDSQFCFLSVRNQLWGEHWASDGAETVRLVLLGGFWQFHLDGYD